MNNPHVSPIAIHLPPQHLPYYLPQHRNNCAGATLKPITNKTPFPPPTNQQCPSKHSSSASSASQPSPSHCPPPNPCPGTPNPAPPMTTSSAL
ncbi:hypothetical protein EJ03DRAFT_220799 [Teratosphaeria nubilosa]|uniref:Uncharacterized protein n=1 Tax=Teratosphaeria nubilosa TaxID=161662 RepID=A0A6G1KWQ5_9PEZI|nr:hypothetical protein EJ03DRAFT_220799 [Teratosphaeria nubilosa]